MPTLQKAHRRVRVKASDWGAQACKTSSKSPIVWVNNVGTFWSGVSSFLVEQAHGFTGPTRIKYPTGISFSPLWTIFTSLLEDETDGSLFGSSLSPWRWLEHLLLSQVSWGICFGLCGLLDDSFGICCTAWTICVQYSVLVCLYYWQDRLSIIGHTREKKYWMDHNGFEIGISEKGTACLVS